MKKLILLFLITLTSCASRQTKIDKLVVKKDSVTETKAVLTVTETKEKTDSTNIITMVDSSEVMITPIDTCKEIVVDGKVYKNVVLRIKKNKVNTSYTNNKRESNIKRTDSIGTTKTSVTEDTVEKIKTIDKKTNYWTLFYWIILFIKRVFDLL
jgi:hypothetical protein